MSGQAGDNKDGLMYNQAAEWDEGVQAVADGVFAQLDLSSSGLANVVEVRIKATVDMLIARSDAPTSGGFPVSAGVLHVIPVAYSAAKVFVAGNGAAGDVHWQAMGFKPKNLIDNTP